MGISNLIRSPSRSKIRSVAFLVLINDLDEGNDSNAELRKYVDDTTSEMVFKGKRSNSQLIADTDVDWSSCNRVQLNSENYESIGFSLPRKRTIFDPLL